MIDDLILHSAALILAYEILYSVSDLLLVFHILFLFCTQYVRDVKPWMTCSRMDTDCIITKVTAVPIATELMNLEWNIWVVFFWPPIFCNGFGGQYHWLSLVWSSQEALQQGFIFNFFPELCGRNGRINCQPWIDYLFSIDVVTVGYALLKSNGKHLLADSWGLFVWGSIHRNT